MGSENFPPKVPPRLMFGVLIGVALTTGLVALRIRSMDVLERFYFKDYLRSSVKAELPKFSRKTVLDKHVLVCVSNAHSESPATVESLAKHGARVSLKTILVQDSGFVGWLKANIYMGDSVAAIFKTQFIVGGVFTFIFAVFGGIFDARYRRKLIEGIQVEGRKLITAKQYNKKVRGDGFILEVEDADSSVQS